MLRRETTRAGNGPEAQPLDSSAFLFSDREARCRPTLRSGRYESHKKTVGR